MADAFHTDRLGRLGYERQARAFVSGTFGVVNDVVRDLRVRPGRKSLVLCSDGVPFYTTADYTSGEYTDVVNALGRLVDQANRASVVLYTIDARGVQTGGLTAQDSLRPDESPSKLAELRAARQHEATITQDPLRYLASETGGLFLGANDLRDSLNRVLDDQAGFYLLGYVPSEDTFKPGDDGPRFHKVKVKVKRSGLQVRSRKSFYGVADVEPVPVPAVTPRGSAAIAVLP
jgi:VWFA-related protein